MERDVTILGESPAMRRLADQIERAAQRDLTILIRGETGTGKELVARAIHARSSRSAGPFVSEACGAIPEGLAEAELFGHEAGAFTGATHRREGMFVRATGGTLFVDEVGDLGAAMQARLLRVLQEGEVRRLGGSETTPVNVRLIASSRHELEHLAQGGEFRRDLLYRLAVVEIVVPPLRERREDIPLLARTFLHRFNRQLNREPPVEGISPEAEALMAAYAWPGNVRELENAMERAVLLTDSPQVLPSNLPERLWTAPSPPAGGPPAVQQAGSDLSLKRAMRELEESYIRAALRRTRGNRTRAAEVLDISHRALLYKIKEYGIDPDAEAEKGS
jgi:two-component system response regulator AtoC